MTTITIEEAQAKLPQLIDQLAPGEEVIISDGQKTVARLVGQSGPARHKPRQPGSAKGKLVILEEDDEHLKDLEDYMP
ncbi:type II toxin-antitoxin system Phd/YefM family antitoxin [Aquisphaera insulae]|uniref:type II toxin-antitoxin system Phd/YefM family antitoxin n=1 Tax=Aquisphaera insulae TaxID=2712864 RepID=UPI0013EC1851|nr:antitoxin of toxin-antitoxin stability system [Aquisphaera insulae]